VGAELETVRVWDVTAGKEIRALKKAGLSGTAKIKIAPGGRTVVGAGASSLCGIP
jgi:hypothetical protein